jgi:phosphatidylserine/phosphatidylglycerophosphate/cardiolipin synthase-like enzyme
MKLDDLRSALAESLRDATLSRGERKAIETMLAGAQLSEHERGVLRAEVFSLARDAAGQGNAVDVIGWIDEALKALEPRPASGTGKVQSDACFSPGDECVNRITGLIRKAKSTIDICVFTITDNRIADAIREAHRNGVRIRILSDNEKSLDLGSDVAQLAAGGVPTRIDTSPYHMHHKFAIFDGQTLLTGSYNWTLGAARDNEENLIVTSDANLLREFQRVFDALWEKCGDFGG